KHVADNEHPDHQHRVDRRTANPGVTGRQFGIDPAQIKYRSDPPNRVILRDRIIKPKRIEKLFLLVVEPPHHAPLPSRIVPPQRNHRHQSSSTDFCNKIGTKRTWPLWQQMSTTRRDLSPSSTHIGMVCSKRTRG